MDFHSDPFWSPVLLSLQIVAIATLIVVVIGVPVARWMARNYFPGKAIVETVLMLPLVLPPTVVGFLLLVVFGRRSPVGREIEAILQQPIVFTQAAAVIAAIVVAFPLMYQTAKAGFATVSTKVEDAARVDGAGEWTIFLYITIPLAWRSILAGIVLSFARALGEFGATLMFAGNIPGVTQTIPTAIYVAVDSGDMRTAWMWVGMMVAMSFVFVFSVYRRQPEREVA